MQGSDLRMSQIERYFFASLRGGESEREGGRERYIGNERVGAEVEVSGNT